MSLFILFQENGSIEVDTLLFIILIVLLFGCFSLFLIKSLKLEMKSQKRVFLGYGLFLLLYGFARLFFLVAMLCGNFFEGCRDFYLTLGYFVGIVGVIFIIYIMETYLLKTKKILTFISISVSIITLIALMGLTTREIANQMIYFLLPSVILAVCFSYIYLIIKTPGSSRRKALWALIGIIVLFFGHLINTHEFRILFPVEQIASILSPIVIMIGVIIFTASQLLIK